MVVPPPPKGGISAPDPGLAYRQQQNRDFRKWYHDHYHPSLFFTSRKSKFYSPGFNYTYWRSKFPDEEIRYREEENRAFKRFIDTGSYPGYPHQFIYT